MEERNDFVATVSHELRTPMTGVYGAAQTLLRRHDELSPEQRATLLSMIATEAARLSQITEEVLLTSQLDRGDLRLETAPVDVREVVSSAVHTMRSHLPDEIEIEVEIGDDVGDASGDSDRIQQVLVNLLDNAAKYGEVGEGLPKARTASCGSRSPTRAGTALPTGSGSSEVLPRRLSCHTRARDRGWVSTSHASSPSGWEAGST